MGSHIEKLVGTCKITLNRIKALSNYRWGADQDSLRKLINAYIRSKLEYGGTIYGHAANAHIRKVQVVWNQAVLLVTGAYRTSPIETLNVAANYIPLQLRSTENNLKFGVKLLNKQNHYLRPLLEKPQLLHRYQQRHTKTIPAIVKLLYSENLMVDMWGRNASMYDWEIKTPILNYIRATHHENIHETFEIYKIRHREILFHIHSNISLSN